MVITVIINYILSTDRYEFSLLSPSSLLPYVLTDDPLCISYRRGFCTACKSSSYLSGTRCQQVSNTCQTYSTINGSCLSCFNQYSLTNSGTCVLTSSLLPANCIELEPMTGRCRACGLGYFLMDNGVCRVKNLGCQTILPNGRCLSCSIGYLFIDYNCVKYT